MNILISSVGRQKFLVNCFKSALNGRGKVIAIDVDKNAKGLSAADMFFLVPPYSSFTYLSRVLDLCKENDIRLIISLNIDELIILKQSEELFTEINCKILGADYKSILNSNDKYQIQIIAEELNLPKAKTFLIGKDFNLDLIVDFPVVAKPRYGKGARGNLILNNRSELEFFIQSIDKTNEYVLQEFLRGDEFGFDIINDLDGKFLRMLGRKKICQRDGESFQAITVDPIIWQNDAIKWSNKLKHTGTANFDVIFINEIGYLIDINLRFSGDYIFSHIAGANTPQLIIDNLFKIPGDDTKFKPIFNIIGERTEDGAKII